MQQPRMSAQLVEHLRAMDMRCVPASVLQTASTCLVDWLAVAIAGRGEPVVACLIDEAVDRGATGRCSIVGRSMAVGPLDAAMINGTMSHALDYDDSLPAMGGHASVSIIPALLSIAQHQIQGPVRLLEAITMGHEAAGWLGAMLGPDHYRRGFHATATIGTMSSALACAYLLDLDTSQTINALSIAATQAAGLRAMFGTMAKPFHAGRAAADGVLAVRLAQRGLSASASPLEHPQGFAAAHGSSVRSIAECPCPEGGFHILGTLFKYNAACYGVQSAIASAIALRHEMTAASTEIATVRVFVAPALDSVCNIAAPVSGLEMKFSLRAVVAMALRGIDMAHPEAFSDAIAHNPDQRAMTERIEIVLDPARSGGCSEITVVMADGHKRTRTIDVSAPETDLEERERRVAAKFWQLCEPFLTKERAASLARVASFADIDPSKLVALTLPVAAREVEYAP